MEFRDALILLVAAADKRMDELNDLIGIAARDEMSEKAGAYYEEHREIEQTFKPFRLYLERTPT